MEIPRITVTQPDWLGPWLTERSGPYRSPEDRMRFVIALSRENVRRGTGGPFAAAVFERTGSFISGGVNHVTSGGCSVFHAEMVAIMLAQAAVGSYDLSAGGTRSRELVTATEPCAMCCGAIPWSGIGSLVCGARSEDAAAIGFDEGPRHPDWLREYQERGIAVTRDVLRNEAAAVLQEYARSGGEIYNPPLKRSAGP